MEDRWALSAGSRARRKEAKRPWAADLVFLAAGSNQQAQCVTIGSLICSNSPETPVVQGILMATTGLLTDWS